MWEPYETEQGLGMYELHARRDCEGDAPTSFCRPPLHYFIFLVLFFVCVFFFFGGGG